MGARTRPGAATMSAAIAPAMAGSDARDCLGALRGDTGSIANLYRRYGPVIHGVLLAKVGYPDAGKPRWIVPSCYRRTFESG